MGRGVSPNLLSQNRTQKSHFFGGGLLGVLGAGLGIFGDGAPASGFSGDCIVGLGAPFCKRRGGFDLFIVRTSKIGFDLNSD